MTTKNSNKKFGNISSNSEVQKPKLHKIFRRTVLSIAILANVATILSVAMQAGWFG